MKIHYSSPLFKLPLLKLYAAMVIGRHCITAYAPGQMPAIVYTHEMVHQSQMDTYGVVPFYAIYLKDYIKGLIKYRDHDKAYHSIPFEIEAYAKQSSVIKEKV